LDYLLSYYTDYCVILRVSMENLSTDGLPVTIPSMAEIEEKSSLR
jgi:hypothetical protein